MTDLSDLPQLKEHAFLAIDPSEFGSPPEVAPIRVLLLYGSYGHALLVDCLHRKQPEFSMPMGHRLRYLIQKTFLSLIQWSPTTLASPRFATQPIGVTRWCGALLNGMAQ